MLHAEAASWGHDAAGRPEVASEVASWLSFVLELASMFRMHPSIIVALMNVRWCGAVAFSVRYCTMCNAFRNAHSWKCSASWHS